MPHIRVELPGLTLDNEFQETTAYLRDLRNWHNASETIRESEQRESGYGMFQDDDPAEAGRFPIVYGKLLAYREGDVWELRRQVMSLKSLKSFEMRVTDPSGAKRAQVAISGQIQFDIMDDGWCEFEIPLEAEDPRLYGPRVTAETGIPTSGVGIADPMLDPLQEGEEGNAGRVRLQNTGTAPSEPSTIVHGGVSGGFDLLCIESSRVVTVTRPIPDGSFVLIDHARGEVWLDGESLLPTTYIPSAEWFEVGPGESCTIQWRPLGALTGTPRMVVEFAEASW